MKVLAAITALVLPAAACTPEQIAAVHAHHAAVEPFDRLAQCESGDRNDTGSPYFGYFQFSLPTWRSLGGVGLPSDHSREHQLEMAMRLQERDGWTPWPHCSRVLGLRG